ncbi:RDD family protein [Solimonas terrae]|uniref:RDD family protein n=1 Tax=Solimonas terrae TaxID=1396819 RepID=A0A6M2BNI3_9GAMM|nr:RDD family protein [Solimonas terrae]NGY03619.1 RDD family protein [Solimonas terrae]
MIESLPPAPLWRRLIAATYDGLLMLALWMVTVLIDAVLRELAGASRSWGSLQLYVFVVWLGFFGWFWTHGGQTLGMRVWRLRVLRDNGDTLNMVSAAVRYAGMLLVWGVALTPLLALTPPLRVEPHAAIASMICGGLTMAMLALMLFDRRLRAPHDWLSGSHLVLLPKPAAKSIG